MRVTLALFALLFAVPAYAATVRISVEGVYDTVSFFQAHSGPDYSPVHAVYDVHSPVLDNMWFNEWSRATTGTAYSDGTSYSKCSGLLRPLCFGYSSMTPVFFGSTLMLHYSSSYWFGFGVGERAISYADDSGYYFRDGDDWIHSIGGADMYGSVTSYTVTTVPLPTSGLLVASSLMLLGWLRRRSHVRNRLTAAA